MKKSLRRVARPSGMFGLLALGLASPLSAQSDLTVSYAGEPGTITRTIVVETADLDAGSAAGQAALNRRIAIAVRKVCGYSTMHGLHPPKDYERCFHEATGQARAAAGRDLS